MISSLPFIHGASVGLYLLPTRLANHYLAAPLKTQRLDWHLSPLAKAGKRRLLTSTSIPRFVVVPIFYSVPTRVYIRESRYERSSRLAFESGDFVFEMRARPSQRSPAFRFRFVSFTLARADP